MRESTRAARQLGGPGGRRAPLAAAAASVLLCACAGAPSSAGLGPQAAVSVPEAWTTRADESMNVDSVATWHEGADRHWLLATAKEGDVLHLFDAASGEFVRDIGKAGTGPGEFDRPNGITVIDDLLVVVERDNRRVQVLSLPDFRTLALFGADRLIKPYGIYVRPLGDDRFEFYVTDNYETADEKVPPLAELGRRVQQWSGQVRRDPSGRPQRVDVIHERAFGETTRPGALQIVESIWGDPQSDRLLIAEEDESRTADARTLKVYGFDGRYQGMIGAGLFRGQVEGIALRACGDGSGQWITTDQSYESNVFLVFDRRSLEFLGAFAGPRTTNTDGIWFTATPMPGFPAGALYAVHDDQSVSAFDWNAIARALGLPEGQCAADAAR